MSGIYRDVNIMKQDDNSDSINVIQEQLHQLSGYEPSRRNIMIMDIKSMNAMWIIGSK